MKLNKKLDGVGPVVTDPPPTSSTTFSNLFLQKKKNIKKIKYKKKIKTKITGDT